MKAIVVIAVLLSLLSCSLAAKLSVSCKECIEIVEAAKKNLWMCDHTCDKVDLKWPDLMKMKINRSHPKYFCEQKGCAETFVATKPRGEAADSLLQIGSHRSGNSGEIRYAPPAHEYQPEYQPEAPRHKFFECDLCVETLKNGMRSGIDKACKATNQKDPSFECTDEIRAAFIDHKNAINRSPDLTEVLCEKAGCKRYAPPAGERNRISTRPRSGAVHENPNANSNHKANPLPEESIIRRYPIF